MHKAGNKMHLSIDMRQPDCQKLKLTQKYDPYTKSCLNFSRSATGFTVIKC